MVTGVRGGIFINGIKGILGGIGLEHSPVLGTLGFGDCSLDHCSSFLPSSNVAQTARQSWYHLPLMSTSASTHYPWTTQLSREIQPRVSWTQGRLFMTVLCLSIMWKWGRNHKPIHKGSRYKSKSYWVTHTHTHKACFVLYLYFSQI